MDTPPNIVWLTLDSVRSDHTTLGGYGRDTTPKLQRIAARDRGRWYPNCFAHSNSTRISTASIVTGTYPSHHGVRNNLTIPEELDTVPEILSEAGYHTVGLSRNANSSMGFDRGFRDFEWISSHRFLEAVDYRTALKYALNIRRHSAGFSADTAKHATPFIINDMAKRRLKSYVGSKEPFFMYLHYNEPHRPYYPPLPYIDRYTDEIAMSTEEATDFAIDMHYNANEHIARGADFSDEQWEALLAMYDAEIAYTDECVGRLFDFIQSIDIGDTVFVVTADHGELFGENGMLAHKVVLHDAVINVPLVIHGLNDLAVAQDDFLQHADIMQTLVAIAGGDVGQFQGIDLRSETRDFVVSQDWEIDDRLDAFQRVNPEFDDSPYHRPLLTCLRDEAFKYQESDEGSELFELPDEETDVSDEYPDRYQEMAEKLESWMDTYGKPITSDEQDGEFSEAMKEQLSDLGYLVD